MRSEPAQAVLKLANFGCEAVSHIGVDGEENLYIQPEPQYFWQSVLLAFENAMRFEHRCLCLCRARCDLPAASLFVAAGIRPRSRAPVPLYFSAFRLPVGPQLFALDFTDAAVTAVFRTMAVCLR